MTKEALKMALEVMRNQGDVSVDEWIATEKAIKEALAEHAMRETQRLGQEIEQEPVVYQCPRCATSMQVDLTAKAALAQMEQEPVAWPCLIDSADFSENTITLVMQCDDYKVSAGTHWLSTTPPKETT